MTSRQGHQSANWSHSAMDRPYTDTRSSQFWYFCSSRSENTSLISFPKYLNSSGYGSNLMKRVPPSANMIVCLHENLSKPAFPHRIVLWVKLVESASSKRGNNVKLVMHQISVDKIENPCYWINRCTFDMVLPSILSTQYWESLIFSPCIVIGEIEHFCVPRGQRRFFIKIEAKASICSWEVCFCCCTH